MWLSPGHAVKAARAMLFGSSSLEFCEPLLVQGGRLLPFCHALVGAADDDRGMERCLE